MKIISCVVVALSLNTWPMWTKKNTSSAAGDGLPKTNICFRIERRRFVSSYTGCFSTTQNLLLLQTSCVHHNRPHMSTWDNMREKVDQVKDTRLIYCHFTTQGCKIRCRYSPVLLFQTNNYYLWWSWRMSGRHIWTPDLNMLTCCLFSCHKLTARCTLPRHGDAQCTVFMMVTNKCW